MVDIDPDTKLPIRNFDDSIYHNASNPLDWPPEDNSTGTWRTLDLPPTVYMNYTVPANDSPNPSTPDEYYGPGNPATGDCLYAAAHPRKYYWQSCQAAFTDNQLQYRVTISGTGQKTDGWCASLLVSHFPLPLPPPPLLLFCCFI